VFIRINLLSAAFILSFSAFAPLVLVSTLVQAQVVEEIVVTARKREESLQEVPISISAFSSRQMQERGITSNYGVAAFTPNFTTSQRVGRDLDRPTIRGMSNPGSRGEPNASYFVDGIFVARTISTANTSSMERVEVLRGPQSAQFGRATFSGAVNYITRKPGNEFEGEVLLRGGSSEEAMASAWWSGPIVEDKLLFLVSGAYDQYGGQWNNNLQPNSVFVNGVQGTFLTNNFTDPDTGAEQNDNGDFSPLGEQETWDFLGKLTWTPTDATELNLKYSFTKGDDGHYPNNVFDTLNCYLPTQANQAEDWYTTSPGAFCGAVTIDGTENRKNIPDLRNGLTVLQQFPAPVDNLPAEKLTSAPVEPGLRRETHRLLGEWLQDIGGWTSTFRASWSDDDFDSAYDLDHQQVRAVWGLFGFNNEFETSDWSVEYSIETPVDRPVRAKLGVYYYDQELIDRQRSATGPLPVFDTEPGTAFQDPRFQDIQNASIFGSVSFDLTDQWTLNFEARYAKDDKDIKSGQRNTAGQSDPVTDSLSFSAFTPRVTMEYAATDDMNFYFLIAKGNKPGGFNTEFFRSDVPSELTKYWQTCDPHTSPPEPNTLLPCTEEIKDRFTFSEEDQWTYEVGIKSTWWDRRVLANLSVFYIDWRNQGLFSIQDLPAAGGGVNTTTILTNAGRSEIYGLELESNFVVTDNLSLIANYGYNHGEFVEGFDPDVEAITGDGNLAGNALFDSPEHSLVLGIDVRAQVSKSLDGFARADFIYDSKRFTTQSNLSWIDERKIVNFRTGFGSDAWTLTFYVRNLMDDDTPLSYFNFVDFASQAPGKDYADFVDLDPPNNGGDGKNGTIDTIADPQGRSCTDPKYAGAPNDCVYPTMGALNPQRGRDWGMEFQYRF